MARRAAQRGVTCCVLLAVGQIAWPLAFAQERNEGWLDELSGWFQSTSDGAEAPTFSTADRAVQDLIAELVLVREAVGVHDTPAEPELHPERRPMHVYAKALEVLSKVTGTQRRFGVPMADPRGLPSEEVDWPEVSAQVLYAIDELRRIKEPLEIDGRIEPATRNSATTSGQLYQGLAYASSLLDGLLGRPLTTGDVYRNCASAVDELEALAAVLGISLLDLEAPTVDQAMGPKDVARRVVLAVSKVIDLQTRLGMDASRLPSLTMVRVSPTEVFDASGILLVEIARVKVHLGIDTPPQDRPDPTGKTLTDAFALTLVITSALDAMTAAIAG